MAKAKTERLLDLVALYLDRRYPIPKREIRENIPAYRRLKLETFDRLFKRDRNDLAKAGVPVKLVDLEDSLEVTPSQAAGYRGEEIGYSIDRDDYFMPQLDLEPEEWLALSLLGKTSPQLKDKRLATSLTSLLQKLRSQTPADLPSRPEFALSPGNRPEAKAESKNLTVLIRALEGVSRLEFDYHSFKDDQVRRRQVEPYGLLQRAGTWYLVGFCLLRKEIRVFRVSRISKLKLLQGGEPFKHPKGFSLASFLGRQPWDLALNPPREVTLQVDPEYHWLILQELGQNARWNPDAGTVTVPVRSTEPFLRWALSQCDRVKILKPESLAQDLKARLDRMAGREAHA